MPPVIILNVVILNCDALVEKQTQNFGKLFIIKPVYKYHLCLHTLSDCHCTQLWEAGLAAERLTMEEQGVVQRKTFFFCGSDYPARNCTVLQKPPLQPIERVSHVLET